jgi:hypothetical protein
LKIYNTSVPRKNAAVRIRKEKNTKPRNGCRSLYSESCLCFIFFSYICPRGKHGCEIVNVLMVDSILLAN